MPKHRYYLYVDIEDPSIHHSDPFSLCKNMKQNPQESYSPQHTVHITPCQDTAPIYDKQHICRHRRPQYSSLKTHNNLVYLYMYALSLAGLV